MRLVDLPRTGGFRLALLFLALFGTASVVLFGFLYLQTQHFILASIDDWLNREAPAPFRAPIAQVTGRFDAHRRSDGGSLERVFALYDPAGKLMAGDDLPLPRDLAILDRPFTFGSRPSGDSQFRGIAHRFPGGETALIAQNLHEKHEFDEAFIRTVIAGGLLTIFLGLLGAVIVGAGTVKRLDALTGAIQEIVRGDLSRRLPSHGTSGDLDRLADVVNGMLDDIERLMQDVKGVCDGIAHDLRTPLTRIMAGLERAQRQAGTQQSYAAAIEDALVEIRGVLKTFAAMLRISELEDSARRAGFCSVDLAEIAHDVVEFYEPVAEERHITLGLVTLPGRDSSIRGDSSLLFDAMANLVDNALKFTSAGGAVLVRLEPTARGVAIGVEDTGSGIPPSEREAVLRRFYRGEKSRHHPGNGLGLALVAAIARLHDLDLAIEPASPGTRVIMRPTPVPKMSGAG